MAKGDIAEIQDAAQVVGFDPSILADYEVETVHVEAGDQLVFDTIGDLYIGSNAGHEIVYPEAQKVDGDRSKFFIQLKWTDPAGSKFTNAGYELTQAYVEIKYADDGTPTVTDKIPVGSLTINELKKLVDVDQASEMKSFRVSVARTRDAGNPA